MHLEEQYCTFKDETVSVSLKTQLVPRSKHFASVIKTIHLVLYREIVAVCSEIHAKHIFVITLWAEHKIFEC